MAGAVERVGQNLSADHRRPFVISGVNAQFVNLAQKDEGLASFLSSADLNVADGVSLIGAARLLGSRLPERITGVDLMVELCGMAAKSGRTVYLLGGMEGAAEGAASFLRNQYPALQIIGVDRPPIGREFDTLVVSQIRTRINDSRPDFLFVCLGVPRQEKWISKFALDLPVKVVMGNGAAFDVLAGFFHRPPMWIQHAGMEWLYRLCVEPRRLWRRYLLGNLHFIDTVLVQAIRTGVLSMNAGTTPH
ncbi:MAG: WecB/TagA/CpsF family glycosyltransferase [Terracidiphilus sp.]